MSLDVVYGESRNRGAAQALAETLRANVTQGTVYFAYPVLTTADERVEVDALLVSREHGLVAFLLADGLPAADGWAAVTAQQDRLFSVLESHLKRHEGLREGRRLALAPATATIFSAPVTHPSGAEGFYGDIEDVPEFLSSLGPISEQVERALQAALQRVSTIKPAKKRVSVSIPGSRGAKLKEIERGIANLDRWQKAAAIESPQGPQRIRGLAGSGKTVVLALKAAYWHSQNPDWRIAVTFHSRALNQQFEDLVTRFSFEHSNDTPDPEFLKIMPSWGSIARPGVYSMIASALGVLPRDWSYARDKYGMDNAFQGICQELLEVAATRDVKPIFDAVLIDEAQDLPPEFFRLVYRFTKDPKRIVWGYDELQKLSESAMPTTDELFGIGPGGESLVNLDNVADSPRRDIVLPICYRNTPWALATAHALGIGVYREGGLVQHPDEPTLWQDIGYDVVHGSLTEGSSVTLRRRADTSPEYFSRLMTAGDAVIMQSFPDERTHDQWLAEQIRINLTADELEHDDILIVLPDTYRAKTRASRLMSELRQHDIPSHLVGVNSSVDRVFQPGSIAIAHIYRAKGNEAPMVYAVDAQYINSSLNVVTKRNTLFTAVTRSRAWVRISGWGPGMGAIASEVATTAAKDYQLEFAIPTTAQLAELRHTNRDRPQGAEGSVRKATEGLETFLEAFDRGEIDILDLPPAVRTRLVTMQLDGLGDND